MPMTNTKTNANTNTKQDTDKEKDKVFNDGRDVNELASTSIQPIQPSHLFIELHLNRRARLFCDIHYTQYIQIYSIFNITIHILKIRYCLRKNINFGSLHEKN